MKRFTAAVLLLVILLPALPCAAAEDIYAAYTPKSERSSLFYLDVFCERDITAAVFDMQFDDSMVSYHAVSADDAAVSVRDYLQDGKVSVAFASTTAVSGKLCRLSFKALKVGSVSFTLHMTQAADADKKLLTQFDDSTLTVKIGKDDIVSSDSGSSKSASAKSSASSGASSKSSKSTRSGERSDEDDEEDDGAPSPYDVHDLRKENSPLKWILLGAGIPLLFIVLIGIGITIGKKSKASDKKTDTKEEQPGEELPEPDDISEDES